MFRALKRILLIVKLIARNPFGILFLRRKKCLWTWAMTNIVNKQDAINGDVSDGANVRRERKINK